MRRIFRTRKPTNFKLGRRTEPTFAKVTILLFSLEQPSATNENTQQHEASHGLSAIAELLVFIPLAFDAPVSGVPVGTLPYIPFDGEKLEWSGYPTVKNFDDMFSSFDRIPACDRRTDRQTYCHGIVHAMHTSRAVKSYSMHRETFRKDSRITP